MPGLLSIIGFTKRERHAVIQDVAETIQAAGGWVLAHHRYSNKAIVIRFELRTGAFPGLLQGLEALEVQVSSESAARIRDGVHSTSQEARDPEEGVPGSLRITFFPTIRICA